MSNIFQKKIEAKMQREKFLMELKMVTPPEQLPEAERLIESIPKAYKKEFINMIICGITPQDSYELLKDTYEF